MSEEEILDFKPRIKDKTWDPAKEMILFRKWQEDGIYKFDETYKREVFSIDTPPPICEYSSPHWAGIYMCLDGYIREI